MKFNKKYKQKIVLIFQCNYLFKKNHKSTPPFLINRLFQRFIFIPVVISAPPEENNPPRTVGSKPSRGGSGGCNYRTPETFPGHTYRSVALVLDAALEHGHVVHHRRDVPRADVVKVGLIVGAEDGRRVRGVLGVVRGAGDSRGATRGRRDSWEGEGEKKKKLGH